MKTTRLTAILLIAMAAIAAVAADASAYYHPTIGRFISRDPGPGRLPRPATTSHFLPRDPTGTNQYADGMNLYEYVGNNPVARVDPRGTDFIAIADRSVVGPTYHYAIMYWRCDCPIATRGGKLNHTPGYSKEELEKMCTRGIFTRGQRLGIVGLLPQTTWTVWGRRRSNNLFSNAQAWGRKHVWISEIVYSNRNATFKIMPIYEGETLPSDADVRRRWGQILRTARGYRWAEQEGFAANPNAPNFRNWPRSLYNPFQTNSNTFVRDTIRTVGLTMVEMTGWHPGNDTPSQNTENAWRGQWRFSAQNIPWEDGQNAPTHPNVPRS